MCRVETLKQAAVWKSGVLSGAPTFKLRVKGSSTIGLHRWWQDHSFREKRGLHVKKSEIFFIPGSQFYPRLRDWVKLLTSTSTFLIILSQPPAVYFSSSLLGLPA